MSVFIATPTFIQPTTAYAFSLANTTAELVKANINYQLGIPDDVKNVDDGRNLLVEKAREGNCTHLFFVDSDQFWSSRDLMKILEWGCKGYSIVAGIYPFKSAVEGYPAGRILEMYENGLMSVSFAPTGFMLIDMKVFDALDEAASEGIIKIPKSGDRPHYFMRTWNDNTYDGGDVTFCRRAIKAGFKVILDPTITVGHVGFHRFQGNFAEYLAEDDANLHRHVGESRDRNRSVTENTPTREPIFADREGLVSLLKAPRVDDTDSWVTDVLKAYGNQPWAATSNLVNKVVQWAGVGRVIEAGCGATTLAMAASGIRVVAYEEHREWAEAVYKIAEDAGIEQNIDIVVSPIDAETKWYNAPDINNHLRAADLLLIDGPRRRADVDRSFPIKRLHEIKHSLLFAYDDIGSITGVSEVNVSPAEEFQHPFCYGRV